MQAGTNALSATDACEKHGIDELARGSVSTPVTT
jgi:hypothetical protein